VVEVTFGFVIAPADLVALLVRHGRILSGGFRVLKW
jgi:hypothetical protein